MKSRLGVISIFWLVIPFSVAASPDIVQSLVVDFPVNGRVIVQAREEIGKFPSLLFVAEKQGKVLLHNSIRDRDKWLFAAKDDPASPNLRFRVIRSKGFASPLIMTVGIHYGGSDHAFYLTVFGEVQGKITRLNRQPIFANIQGGYYLGYLNDKVGYGLAAWNFIWGHDFGEGHYGLHKYEIEIYQLQNGQFKRTMRRVSKRKYGGNGADSLRELGMKVHDQRSGVPKIKDSLE